MRRLIAAHDAVQHAAFHDPLTGLANRDSLMLQLDLAMEDPGLGGQLVGVLEIQLLQFDEQTGRRGRAAAEAVLTEIAARLSGMCRGDDIVARLDGASYAVVFTDILDDAELEERAQEVARQLSEPIVLDREFLRFAPTIGAAAATAGRMLAHQAMAAASFSLADARIGGPGAVRVAGSAEVLREAEAARQAAEDRWREAASGQHGGLSGGSSAAAAQGARLPAMGDMGEVLRRNARWRRGG